MKRHEIIESVRSRIGEFSGAPGERDPQSLDDLVTRVADEIAVQTLCLHQGFLADLGLAR